MVKLILSFWLGVGMGYAIRSVMVWRFHRELGRMIDRIGGQMHESVVRHGQKEARGGFVVAHACTVDGKPLSEEKFRALNDYINENYDPDCLSAKDKKIDK